MSDSDEEVLEDKHIPKPCGYKILVALPTMAAITEKGVYLPDEHVSREEVAQLVARVIELGSDCYTDTKRFPNGPWCKVGDFVMFRSYTGTRFKLAGQEFRLINDDAIDAVIEDASMIRRV
jgi:co-chaperonin GroES (HSP10)